MRLTKEKEKLFNEIILPKLYELNNAALHRKIVTNDELFTVCQECITAKAKIFHKRNIIIALAIVLIGILCAIPILNSAIDFLFGLRCIVPNNYIIWEATRPISECEYCRNIEKPVILPNVTSEQFLPLAYSLQPIIVKGAVLHWPAKNQLTYKFIKDLYQRYPDDLERFHEECQFLSFKSNIRSLHDLFRMPDDRITSGQDPWYIGFSNCQTNILKELRKLYPIPHFLPKDAEIPNTDYIFLGYDQGAIMHLDYIPRLMWQAQLHGNKSWNLAPTPECDHECRSFSFYVEPGDIVLIDTRVWYHSTSVAKGEFSLTIQSEYG